MEHRVVVLGTYTATVDEAATAHGVDPDQIGKSLSFYLDGRPILIFVAGSVRCCVKITAGCFNHIWAGF